MVIWYTIFVFIATVARNKMTYLMDSKWCIRPQHWSNTGDLGSNVDYAYFVDVAVPEIHDLCFPLTRIHSDTPSPKLSISH